SAKEIGAETVDAVEIVGRRSERNVSDAALRIDGHLSPVIVAANVFPCILRPGVVAELSGTRYGVKGPCQFAVADVVGTNVSRRRKVSFTCCAAEDEKVFENLAGSVRLDIPDRGRVASINADAQ